MNTLADGGTFLGWYWILWVGFIFLLFSNMGNWGYSYQAHRKYDGMRRTANDIIDERYARGEIDRATYQEMKSEILAK